MVVLIELLTALQTFSDANSQIIWAQILQCLVSIVAKMDIRKTSNEDDNSVGALVV